MARFLSVRAVESAKPNPKSQSYMIINLRGTYYHYCELPPATFDGLMGAPSMGQYYNANIKGNGSDGPYDCRTHRVPSY
jgi:KTSC domain